uniref:Arrestin domain containing 3 n=1 Tax=Eptatretus burgeri TaxID=7764 RepID=A0A8C4QEJ1_EPTBU
MLLGKVKSLRVAFDGDHRVAASAVFTSGDLVSGRVLLEAAGSVRVRSLRLMARGHARVHWTESRNAGSNTAYTQNYSDELDLFNHREAIIEPGADDEEEDGAVLQPGRHEFAFNFQLPQGPLATSFEGKYGFIRYWVKVELGRPWALVQKVKAEFTVIDQVDIGTPELMAPAGGTTEKTLCCWFCTSGPISLSAKIQRKGYCPGESIPIHAEIENCSSRPIVPKAAIYQTQIFCAKGKQKPVRQLVTNLRGEPVPPGRTDVWNGRLLKIPPVSPSILVCSLIRVQYELLSHQTIRRHCVARRQWPSLQWRDVPMSFLVCSSTQCMRTCKSSAFSPHHCILRWIHSRWRGEIDLSISLCYWACVRPRKLFAFIPKDP